METGEDSMKRSEIDETTWLMRLRRKIDEQMDKKEIETILYWKAEMEKILTKRPESLGTFLMEIQNLVQRMQNRVRVLKSSSPK